LSARRTAEEADALVVMCEGHGLKLVRTNEAALNGLADDPGSPLQSPLTMRIDVWRGMNYRR
jgi:hypothetical protein